MQITVLAENTSLNENITAEHGLSLYIEACGKKLLFDMGQSDLFFKNAKTLGIDLSKVDIAVLSHGHYDHGGGLETFLSINKTAPVYISKNAFLDYYNGTEKYIGLDKSLADDPRFVFLDKTTKIQDGFILYNCNESEKSVELGSFGLLQRTENGFEDDRFDHEQYLEIIEDGKRALVSGCSHKGILNIVKWFEPDALVGGFHFSKLPLDGTLEGYAKTLAAYDTAFFTCHCTGTEQYEFMKKYIPRLSYISAGTVIKI